MATTSREIAEIAAHLRLGIVRTARRMRQEATGAEPGRDLSPTLAAALATVERHGPLTPSELADLERVQRPTATRIVASLGERELITRTADPADKRSALVTITSEGRAVLRRLRKRKNAYLARRMRELDPGDLATLDRAAAILERMLDEEHP